MTAAGAVGVIGAGRAGISLALALVDAGWRVRIYSRRAKPVPSSLELTVGPASRPPPWIGAVDSVLLAVRDDALGELARMLARTRAVDERHVVLHLSGSLGRDALAALDRSGASLGSVHFLQTFVDPENASDALRGARAAVEGDQRALERGETIARSVGAVPFILPSDRKPLYHAAAVFASNYPVVLAAVAERLARVAGLPREEAWPALKPLIQGTVNNLMDANHPVDALTGPVVRGDAATLQRHLEMLTEGDAALYRALARSALALAKARGLDAADAERIESLLVDDARARQR